MGWDRRSTLTIRNMPRLRDETKSTFLRTAAEVLAAEGELPFQDLARKALATGHVATSGRTPSNTLFSLLRRAQEADHRVDGKRFVTYKVGSRLWVRMEAVDKTA